MKWTHTRIPLRRIDNIENQYSGKLVRALAYTYILIYCKIYIYCTAIKIDIRQ